MNTQRNKEKNSVSPLTFFFFFLSIGLLLIFLRDPGEIGILLGGIALVSVGVLSCFGSLFFDKRIRNAIKGNLQEQLTKADSSVRIISDSEIKQFDDEYKY
ncbi:MAG: hypothetical protein ACTSQK_12055 [Candidatus Heimdallarchaeota archaeon]